MRRFAFLLVLLFSLSAFSQAKHPFTFEDMMKLKRVGEPVPSPDGKWVLFSVVDVDLAANKKTPHIWIVPLNTSSGATGVPPVQQAPRGPASERILIPGQDGDRPRWAPDGKRFAFLSTKEGGSQVWIAEFDGAAGSVTGIHKLTSIVTEAGGELWSPDGKHVLFTSDVYPECDGAPVAEEACNSKKVKDAEQSKVKALIFDHLLYRHWNAYKEGKRTHIFVMKTSVYSSVGRKTAAYYPGDLSPDGSSPRDLTPGDYDAPVFSLGGQDNYAFSPDGQEICYTSNHDKVEATSTNNDLWIVPVNSGATGASPVQAKNITADNPASDSTPLYSPNGKYIAYRAQQRPGYESDLFRLMLYDRKTGEKKNLTENFDQWVETFAWATDSKTIFYVWQHTDTASIAHLDLPADAAAQVDPHNVVHVPGGLPSTNVVVDNPRWSGTLHGIGDLRFLPREFGYSDDPTPTPDGQHILYTRNSVYAPTEIYEAPIQTVGKGNGPQQLSHVNDSILFGIDMPEMGVFTFSGANGDKVEGLLVTPPNFDAKKKYPVKFLIHGGPQGAWGDDWSFRWNPELFAANGYVVIMINFHGSTGYGQKFIDAINGDWGGAPFEDLMKGLDYAEKTYPFIDRDRECALGASYGGYMANWVLGHTGRFKCIVSHDGMFNTDSAWGTTEELWFNNWEFKGTPYTNPEMYEKWSPRNAAKNFKTPTLVIHGQLDYRLDVSEGFQLFTTLQTMGVPSKMLYFPDEGHWVLKPQNSQLWYKTVNDWVDQWIGMKK
jgi:dipeptidyl aminopeptidase/acylaminoacyl peptidase